jgi:NAD(P)-dependent dehydrogenase (short-subunit alcohol dehydrogenase family)
VVGLTEDQMMRAVRSKITGPLLAAGVAAQRINGPGSITFTSGIAAHRPAPEGRSRPSSTARSTPWSGRWRWNSPPVRVNTVSPGWMDTAAWDKIATPEVRV